MAQARSPATGNIELLHRFASPVQRAQWLTPLLEGQIRSAFAMSEPDVASSAPPTLQRHHCMRMGSSSAWFTTPEQLQAPPRIR